MSNKNFKLMNSALFQRINRNVVHPNISLSPEVREVSTNIEIVELNNSLDNIEEKVKTENFSFDLSWSSHNYYPDEESYRTNKRARDKRRLEKEAKERFDKSATCENYEFVPSHNYPSFYSLDRDYCDERDYHKIIHNRPVNCFTIPNNLGTPSTSSDDQNEIENIHCGDTIPNRNFWGNDDAFDEVYFSQDLETDKRTIWIYSFKNKRTLSENDYVLTNIQSKDFSSSGSSDEVEYAPTKEGNSRKATPIPHIPRLNLNLTATLPTVTEVSESTKPTTAEVRQINSYRDQIVKEDTKVSPKGNLFHPLSPRIRVKTPKEINDNVDIENDGSLNDAEVCESITKNDIKEDLEHNISKSDRDLEEVHDEIIEEVSLEKPRITLTPKLSLKELKISDPIEKLEGNWIGENVEVNENTFVYDHDIPNTNMPESPITSRDKVEENFFIRNLPLLKPAEWNEYMPITDSIPSIELSIITNIDTKQSWFKKLLRCVCFRRDK